MVAVMSGLDDRELMAQVKTGSHHAFAELVKRHAEMFYRISYRYVSERTTAEDIVQQAFLKLWECPEKYNPGAASFKVWFSRAVVNLSIDSLRRKKPSFDVSEYDVADGSENAEEEVIRNSREQLLEQAIAKLPSRQKAALNLGFYEDLPYDEVAKIMNLSTRAVQSLIMRAKNNLKKYVGDTANV